MTAAGDYGGPEHDRPYVPPTPQRQPTAAEAFAAIVQKNQADRDRAVGAVLLLAHDGVISQSRAGELLGMTITQIRDEFRRINAEARP